MQMYTFMQILCKRITLFFSECTPVISAINPQPHHCNSVRNESDDVEGFIVEKTGIHSLKNDVTLLSNILMRC